LIYRDKAVTLSPSEAEVMRLLLDAKSNPVSRANIAKAIGDSATNKADVYVCYLRRKLATLTDRNHLITVRGVGYRFHE
jgi:DNA-binding response OmpR family regulator